MMRRRDPPPGSRPGRNERGSARDALRCADADRTAGKMMALAWVCASVPVPPAHHGHCLGSSAVRDAMTLPSQPSAASAARAHAQRVLRDWGFGPRLCEDVTLCLSELVTNAIQASAVWRPPVAPVHVGLTRERRWLLLAVGDASPRFPLRLPADRGAVGGRGLAMVEALSSRWGWHPVSWPGLVKVVWAEWSSSLRKPCCRPSIRGRPSYSPGVKPMKGDRHCTPTSRRYQPPINLSRRIR